MKAIFLTTTVCLHVLTVFCTTSSVEELLQQDGVKEECHTGDEELQLVQKNAQKHVSKGKTAHVSQTQNLLSLPGMATTTMMDEYHPKLLGKIVTLPPGVNAPGQKPSSGNPAGDFGMMMKIGKKMAVITGALFFVFTCAIGSYIWFFAEEKIEGALTMKAEMNKANTGKAENTAKYQTGDNYNDVINECLEDDNDILPLEGKKDTKEHSVSAK